MFFATNWPCTMKPHNMVWYYYIYHFCGKLHRYENTCTCTQPKTKDTQYQTPIHASSHQKQTTRNNNEDTPYKNQWRPPRRYCFWPIDLLPDRFFPRQPKEQQYATQTSPRLKTNKKTRQTLKTYTHTHIYIYILYIIYIVYSHAVSIYIIYPHDLHTLIIGVQSGSKNKKTPQPRRTGKTKTTPERGSGSMGDIVDMFPQCDGGGKGGEEQEQCTSQWKNGGSNVSLFWNLWSFSRALGKKQNGLWMVDLR